MPQGLQALLSSYIWWNINCFNIVIVFYNIIDAIYMYIYTCNPIHVYLHTHYDIKSILACSSVSQLIFIQWCLEMYNAYNSRHRCLIYTRWNFPRNESKVIGYRPPPPPPPPPPPRPRLSVNHAQKTLRYNLHIRALAKGAYTRIMHAYDKHASARIWLKNECA